MSTEWAAESKTPRGHAKAATSLRPAARVELIAAVLLALSTLVAVTAVSIGIARADLRGAHTNGDAMPFAVAWFEARRCHSRVDRDRPHRRAEARAIQEQMGKPLETNAADAKNLCYWGDLGHG